LSDPDSRPAAAARSPWLPRSVIVTATAISSAALVAHAWPALTGIYLNLVSGIWLALGRDLAAGLFYRDLISDVGYGGTRYFPLFFLPIGALIRGGVPPLAAGWMVSGLAAVVLASGLARVARALGAPTAVAIFAAATSVAPYFVQQTIFEIRADVLAAGLNLWGLAFVIQADRAWQSCLDPESRRVASPTGLAVLFFTLAVLTKITSVALPLSVIVGLAISGRRAVAWPLASRLTLSAATFLIGVHVFSDGRAITSWRACMFAGSSGGQAISSLFAGEFLPLVGYSHFLATLFGLMVVALVASRLRAPAVVFAGVTLATAFALSSPGTVASNQVVEWIEIAFALLLWIAAERDRLRPLAMGLLAVFMVWASLQDFVRTRALASRSDAVPANVTRQAIVKRIADAGPGPVLAESALWPVLAGQQAYLLDPFALRVIMESRPDIAADLSSKINARFFSIVLLQMDPTTERGRGHYEHVHFGWPIIERILANYRLDSQPARDVYVYVPR
jgi:hypothetical protein